VPNTESVKGKDPLSMSKDSRVACFHFLYLIDTFKIDTLTSKGSIQLKPAYKARRDSTSIETSSLRDDECGYNGGEIQEAHFFRYPLVAAPDGGHTETRARQGERTL
jgi:hypothetical protein